MKIRKIYKITFINYNSSNIKNVYTENGIINNFYLGCNVSYEIDSERYSGIITKINVEYLIIRIINQMI